MNLVDKLPHKPPALLIDDVVEINENSVTCRMSKTPDASIAPDGKIPAPLGLEAIAQAAAVWMCWRYEALENKGMLVHCRNFEMKTRFFDASSDLTAFARPISVGSLTGLHLFYGDIKAASGEILACGDFMIYAKDKA